MTCSVAAVRLSRELKRTRQAEAYEVIAGRRRIVVAVRNAAVLRIVVPAAAAIHAVVALWPLSFMVRENNFSRNLFVCA